MLFVLASGIPAHPQIPIVVPTTPVIGGSGGIAHLQEQRPDRAPTEVLNSVVRQLDLQEVPLDAALAVIAGRAGVRLGYSPEILPVGRRVTLRAAETSVEEAFARVLDGTGLMVVPVGSRQLALVRRPAGEQGSDAEENVARAGVVTGRVTDASSGAPLAGATVRLAAGRPGTLTRPDGRFRLEGVPAGTHAIVASMIGYSPARREVAVQGGEAVEADFALTVSAVPLDQVIVTGTVTPTEVRAVPSPISVVTGAEIQERNIRRVDELFRGGVPGSVAWNYGATGHVSDIVIRGGNSVSAVNTVKTYIDGVEVADFRLIATIDPSSIERVEILRGPQASTIYGTNASGGVMQIFTRRGTASPRPQIQVKTSVGRIESEYSSSATATGDHSLLVSGGEQGFSYNVGGSYQGTGEWAPEHFVRNSSLFGGVTATHGAFTADVSSRYFSRRWGQPNDPRFRDLGYSNWLQPFHRDENIVQHTSGIRLSYSASPSWDHTLAIGSDESVWATLSREPRRLTPADTFLYVQDSRSSKRSVAYNSTIRLRPLERAGATITAGLDHAHFEASGYNTSRANGTYGTISATPVGLARWDHANSGAFGQVMLDFADRLFVTGGLRGDRNDGFGEEYGTAWSPRFGIAYTPVLGELTLKTRASYGSATRSPQPTQKIGDVTATRILLANPLLGPERQVGGDLGIDLMAGSRWSLSATYFDQLAVNLITLVLIDPSTVPNTLQNQNIGEISNRGLELEGQATAGRVSVNAQHSLISSTIRSLAEGYRGDYRVGDRQHGVPTFTSQLRLDVRLPRQLTVGGSVFRTGEHDGLDYIRLYGAFFGGQTYTGVNRDYWTRYPGFTKANVNASAVIGRGLELFLTAENITNSVAVEHNNLHLLPGRTVILGARWSN